MFQTLSILAQSQIDSIYSKKINEVVYSFVEPMPIFVGGTNEFNNYIKNNSKIKIANNDEKSLKTYLKFLVTSQGTISNIEIIKTSGNDACDKEAVRLISQSPPWIPGKFNEKNINASVNLNLKFSESEFEIQQVIEEMPEFPGGAMQLMYFVQKNINYPVKEKKEKISGKVFVKFVVEASGLISGINVIKSSGNENLDKEAIRIVSVMPKWTPGKQNGKPVPVYFNLPVTFQP